MLLTLRFTFARSSQMQKLRVLGELHRDLSYLMMRKVLGWLGLTVGKPQDRSQSIWGVAFGSATSHPDLGSC